MRITVQDVDSLSPEQLLQAIRDSYPNQRVRAVLYLLLVGQPAECAEVESNAVVLE